MSAPATQAPGPERRVGELAAPQSRVRPRPGNVPLLDGLRGTAILLVLAHNGGIEQVRTSSLWLKALFFMHAPGWIGVQFFFVLSGFLITGVLVDSRGPGALRSFWIRRALRIFPLYFSFLFLVTFVLPALWPLSEFKTNGNIWWYWTYLSNWGQSSGHKIPALAHFWSLSIEEQFYLVWPLAALALDRRALLRVSVFLAAVALALRIALSTRHMPEQIYQYTFTRMDSLTLGAAAAVIARERAWLERVVPHLGRVLVLCIATVAILWPFTRGFNVLNPAVQTIGFTALSVFVAALILWGLVHPQFLLPRLLASRCLRWLGKYSYAIYVVHLPISRIVAHWYGPTINGGAALPAAAALLALELTVAGLSIGAAILSWNLIESRALALKDRLAPRPATALAVG